MTARPKWMDEWLHSILDAGVKVPMDQRELAAYFRDLEAELTGWRNIGAETPEGLNAIMEMSLEVNRTITIPKIERLQTEQEQLKAELKQANLDALNIAKGLGGVAAKRDALRAERNTLRKQRDELLKALKEIIESGLRPRHALTPCECVNCRIRNLVAKADGFPTPGRAHEAKETTEPMK